MKVPGRARWTPAPSGTTALFSALQQQQQQQQVGEIQALDIYLHV